MRLATKNISLFLTISFIASFFQPKKIRSFLLILLSSVLLFQATAVFAGFAGGGGNDPVPLKSNDLPAGFEKGLEEHLKDQDLPKFSEYKCFLGNICVVKLNSEQKNKTVVVLQFIKDNNGKLKWEVKEQGNVWSKTGTENDDDSQRVQKHLETLQNEMKNVVIKQASNEGEVVDFRWQPDGKALVVVKKTRMGTASVVTSRYSYGIESLSANDHFLQLQLYEVTPTSDPTERFSVRAPNVKKATRLIKNAKNLLDAYQEQQQKNADAEQELNNMMSNHLIQQYGEGNYQVSHWSVSTSAGNNSIVAVKPNQENQENQVDFFGISNFGSRELLPQVDSLGSVKLQKTDELRKVVDQTLAALTWSQSGKGKEAIAHHTSLTPKLLLSKARLTYVAPDGDVMIAVPYKVNQLGNSDGIQYLLVHVRSSDSRYQVTGSPQTHVQYPTAERAKEQYHSDVELSQRNAQQEIDARTASQKYKLYEILSRQPDFKDSESGNVLWRNDSKVPFSFDSNGDFKRQYDEGKITWYAGEKKEPFSRGILTRIDNTWQVYVTKFEPKAMGEQGYYNPLKYDKLQDKLSRDGVWWSNDGSTENLRQIKYDPNTMGYYLTPGKHDTLTLLLYQGSEPKVLGTATVKPFENGISIGRLQPETDASETLSSIYNEQQTRRMIAEGLKLNPEQVKVLSGLPQEGGQVALVAYSKPETLLFGLSGGYSVPGHERYAVVYFKQNSVEHIEYIVKPNDDQPAKQFLEDYVKQKQLNAGIIKALAHPGESSELSKSYEIKNKFPSGNVVVKVYNNNASSDPFYVGYIASPSTKPPPLVTYFLIDPKKGETLKSQNGETDGTLPENVMNIWSEENSVPHNDAELAMQAVKDHLNLIKTPKQLSIAGRLGTGVIVSAGKMLYKYDPEQKTVEVFGVHQEGIPVSWLGEKGLNQQIKKLELPSGMSIVGQPTLYPYIGEATFQGFKKISSLNFLSPKKSNDGFIHITSKGVNFITETEPHASRNKAAKNRVELKKRKLNNGIEAFNNIAGIRRTVLQQRYNGQRSVPDIVHAALKTKHDTQALQSLMETVPKMQALIKGTNEERAFQKVKLVLSGLQGSRRFKFKEQRITAKNVQAPVREHLAQTKLQKIRTTAEGTQAAVRTHIQPQIERLRRHVADVQGVFRNHEAEQKRNQQQRAQENIASVLSMNKEREKTKSLLAVKQHITQNVGLTVKEGDLSGIGANLVLHTAGFKGKRVIYQYDPTNRQVNAIRVFPDNKEVSDARYYPITETSNKSVSLMGLLSSIVSPKKEEKEPPKQTGPEDQGAFRERQEAEKRDIEYLNGVQEESISVQALVRRKQTADAHRKLTEAVKTTEAVAKSLRQRAELERQLTGATKTQAGVRAKTVQPIAETSKAYQGLQAGIRAHKGEQRFTELKNAAQWTNAAVKKRGVYKPYVQKVEAIAGVEGVIRTSSSSVAVNQQRNGAVLAQAVVNGNKDRKRFNQKKEDTEVLQAPFRGKQTADAYRELTGAVETTEAAAKGQQKQLGLERLQEAAKGYQAGIRSYDAQQRLKRTFKTAQSLQAVGSQKIAGLDIKKQQKAGLTIQRWFRGHRTKKRVNEAMPQLKRDLNDRKRHEEAVRQAERLAQRRKKEREAQMEAALTARQKEQELHDEQQVKMQVENERLAAKRNEENLKRAKNADESFKNREKEAGKMWQSEQNAKDEAAENVKEVMKARRHLAELNRQLTGATQTQAGVKAKNAKLIAETSKAYQDLQAGVRAHKGEQRFTELKNAAQWTNAAVKKRGDYKPYVQKVEAIAGVEGVIRMSNFSATVNQKRNGAVWAQSASRIKLQQQKKSEAELNAELEKLTGWVLEGKTLDDRVEQARNYIDIRMKHLEKVYHNKEPVISSIQDPYGRLAENDLALRRAVSAYNRAHTIGKELKLPGGHQFPNDIRWYNMNKPKLNSSVPEDKKRFQEKYTSWIQNMKASKGKNMKYSNEDFAKYLKTGRLPKEPPWLFGRSGAVQPKTKKSGFFHHLIGTPKPPKPREDQPLKFSKTGTHGITFEGKYYHLNEKGEMDIPRQKIFEEIR